VTTPARRPFEGSKTDAHDNVVIEAEDLHLPLNKPVKVLLRSIDVLHSFYVPEFRAKMDLVPGMVSYVWFTPTRTGTFELLCAELCGAAHYAMRGKVVVDEEKRISGLATKTKDVRTIVGSHQTSEGNAVDLALSHGAARGEETIRMMRLKVVEPHRKERGHSNG
jgi:heme/copper-type cytochrome/quinol oxidase subunit 2